MKKLTIAFDVDDTLIIPNVANGTIENTPNYEVISIYKFFQNQGHEMIVWSGVGVDYAKRWAEKLGLNPDKVILKEKSDDIDIAVDDCDVELAKVNIKIKRLNNQISREEWNNRKII